MRHRTPEAQHGHVLQRLEETKRQQKYTDQHHPAAGVDHTLGERPDHQVAADNYIQDASHQQLDDLRDVDGACTPSWPEAFLGDGHVRISYAHTLTRHRIQLVQALDKDLAGVATDVRDADHRGDRPITAT